MAATPRYTRAPLRSRLAGHLIRRGRSFHYRRKVPRDLRHLLSREVTRSLGTRSLLVARKRARLLDDQVCALFTLARRPGVTPEELDALIARLVDDYIVRWVTEDRRERWKEEDPERAVEDLEISGMELLFRLSEDPAQVDAWHREQAAEVAARGGVELDAAGISRLAYEMARAGVRVAGILAEERRVDLAGAPRVPWEDLLGHTLPPAPPVRHLAHPVACAVEGKQLGDGVEEFLKEAPRRHWTKRHSINVRSYLRSLTEHLGSGRPLARIQKADVMSWRESLRKKGRSEVTVGKYIKNAHQFFAFAVDAEWMPSNPAERLPGGNAGRDKRRPDELRDAVSDEALKLIVGREAFARLGSGQAKEQELFWAVLLLVYTGARREEVAEAWVEDIYQDAGVWCLRVEPSDVPGAEKSVKSAASRRLIPLHSDLIALGLPRFLAAAAATGRKRLFPSLARQQGDPLTRAWKRWRDETGADPKATPHGLRHRFATQLKRAGAADERMAELLGHANRSLATGRYGKRDPVATVLQTVNLIDNRGPLECLFERVQNGELNSD